MFPTDDCDIRDLSQRNLEAIEGASANLIRDATV